MNDMAPKKEVRIKCSSCGVESSFSESARQERLSAPYESILESLIVCPHCGLRTHSYYQSPEMDTFRSDLKKLTIEYNRFRTQKTFNLLKAQRDRFRELFDSEQLKYRSIMEKVVVWDVAE